MADLDPALSARLMRRPTTGVSPNEDSLLARLNLESPWTVAALLVAAAFLIRGSHFGNPALHIDEQFYLLTGRAMLGGELPYVDIWDRKPIGLFLIYAATSLLGGSGILQYQIVATLFAAATAFTITRIARRYSTDGAALFAGAAYLATIEPLSGGGGQAPVFYNLLMANAALLVLRCFDLSVGSRLYWTGLGAVVLAGLSLTIKQIAVVESCFFGLALLWTIWIKTRSAPLVAKWGGVYVAAGIAPTAAALLAYAALGHADAFWFANFTSIFLKSSPSAEAALRLLIVLAAVAPLAICAAIGFHHRRRSGHPNAGFLIGWLGASIIGLLALPYYYDHYALPVTLPLAIAASPAFERPRIGLLWSGLAIIAPLSLSGYPYLGETRESARLHSQAAALIQQNLRGGCLYVHEGPVHLYNATSACRVSRFVFPDHLNSALEASGIGVDPAKEMRALLARAPTVIVTTQRLIQSDNNRTRDILDAELARNYRLDSIATVTAGPERRKLQIWVRNGQG